MPRPMQCTVFGAVDSRGNQATETEKHQRKTQGKPEEKQAGHGYHGGAGRDYQATGTKENLSKTKEKTRKEP
mgnify:CR=1 FL=1